MKTLNELMQESKKVDDIGAENVKINIYPLSVVGNTLYACVSAQTNEGEFVEGRIYDGETLVYSCYDQTTFEKSLKNLNII
ncbi:MAG: hypothetical protein PHY21_10230 [Candidatus Cloacimonetes bacterium]|nr:hypothetical protein [Candidatus Cloacimonadota bacterium]